MSTVTDLRIKSPILRSSVDGMLWTLEGEKWAGRCKYCGTWLTLEKKALQPFDIRCFGCKLWVPSP